MGVVATGTRKCPCPAFEAGNALDARSCKNHPRSASEPRADRSSDLHPDTLHPPPRESRTRDRRHGVRADQRQPLRVVQDRTRRRRARRGGARERAAGRERSGRDRWVAYVWSEQLQGYICTRQEKCGAPSASVVVTVNVVVAPGGPAGATGWPTGPGPTGAGAGTTGAGGAAGATGAGVVVAGITDLRTSVSPNLRSQSRKHVQRKSRRDTERRIYRDDLDDGVPGTAANVRTRTFPERETGTHSSIVVTV